MSESERFPLNQTDRIMDIPEMYQTTTGKAKEWDLKGYHAPSTSLDTPRMYKIPTEKKKDVFYEIAKHSKDPDPTTYSPKQEQIYKRHWDKPNGRFLKSKRETFTESIIKASQKLPGPSEYNNIPKGSFKPLDKASLGKFE
jgi:hypothetical protein